VAHKFERYFDMPMAAKVGEKHVPRWLSCFLGAIASFITHVCFKLKATNAHNVTDFVGKTGVMVMGNHTSYLDVAFNIVSLRKYIWARYMARDTLFEAGHGVVGWIFSRLGVFPVKRDSADKTAIKRATRMLTSGEVVTILPEGTRRGKGTAEIALHSGAAFIAKRANVPIVPLAVINAEKIKQKGKAISWQKVLVKYGNPHLVEDFDFLPKADRLDACTWYVMREVHAMVQGIAPEDVDMKALFPKDRDFSAEFENVQLPIRTPAQTIDYLQQKKDEKLLKKASQDEAAQGSTDRFQAGTE